MEEGDVVEDILIVFVDFQNPDFEFVYPESDARRCPRRIEHSPDEEQVQSAK
jgi:hypothetical protein